ncbi:MAG: hypothetical protein KGI06_04870 [Candidatus Micrarchaeota archaeon]|nr:hypothetical protein [Candidatus Micrarchaeota archaeon]
MNFAKSLRSIYGPKYIAANVAIAVAYYYLIEYLLSVQQRGIPVTSVPVYLIYALVITSSITFTIAIYSISNTRKNYARVSASSVSAITAVAGGILSGCGCQAAILFNVLSISIGTGEATMINTIASENAPIIFGAMIIINLFVSGYYLEKLSSDSCKIKRA